MSETAGALAGLRVLDISSFLAAPQVATFLGDFGAVSGPGIKDLIAAEDQDLADQLDSQIANSVNLAAAIPEPFDQHLSEGVSDQTPGRQAVRTTIVSLENQTDTIVDAAQKIGITISVS